MNENSCLIPILHSASASQHLISCSILVLNLLLVKETQKADIRINTMMKKTIVYQMCICVSLKLKNRPPFDKFINEAQTLI